jgi:hypothetical protein
MSVYPVIAYHRIGTRLPVTGMREIVFLLVRLCSVKVGCIGVDWINLAQGLVAGISSVSEG